MGSPTLKRRSSQRAKTVISRLLVLLSVLLYANSALAVGHIIYLPVQREIQQNSLWCWAAVGTAVTNRYGTYPTWTNGSGQCAFVQRYLEHTRSNWTTDCCATPTPNDCNIGIYFDNWVVAYNLWGIEGTTVNDSLTKSQALSQISDLRRPFAIVWDWQGYEIDHTVLAVGIEYPDSSSNVERLLYMEPGDVSTEGGYVEADWDWVKEGISAYSTLEHKWIATFKYTESPPEDFHLRHSFNEQFYWYKTAEGDHANAYVEDFLVDGWMTEITADKIVLGSGFQVNSGATFKAISTD